LTGTPIELVVDVFNELGLKAQRVGAELGYEQRLGMPINDFLSLQRALGDVSFVDASELLWKLRMIKSEAEINAHRQACELTTLAFEACYKQAKEGDSELDIAKTVTQTIVDGGGELGFTILCSGPGNYARVAGMPTGRVLRSGDLIWLDLGAVANGYWSDFCRAGVVGGPTDEQKRLQEVVVQITHKAMEQVHPGMKASELARACGRAAEEYNIDFSFEAGRLGGIGLNSTEPPHIAVYDDTILEPGMVITIEPGIVNEHGTFIAEENLVVRPEGFELLSLSTRELRVL
jgi:Xaa-Pro aminopeptidase